MEGLVRFACLQALATGLLLTGCGTCDTRGQLPIEFRGGTTDLETMSYETSGVSGEYLHFPPGRRFDLMHDLGVTPQGPLSWVSFKREPFSGSDSDPGEENTGNIAESAGNQVVVECLDEERVRVRNDTCAEFYLRVELRANRGLTESGAAGAAGDSNGAAHPCLPVRPR